MEDMAGVVFDDASYPGQFDRYPAGIVEYLAEVEATLPRMTLR
jgi:hypothetical protein